jgi:hypothetical protein
MDDPNQETPQPSARWSKLLLVFSALILIAIALKISKQQGQAKPSGLLLTSLPPLKTNKSPTKVELISPSTIPAEEKWSQQIQAPTITNPESFSITNSWTNASFIAKPITTQLDQSESWTSFRPSQTLNVALRTLENWTPPPAETPPRKTDILLAERWSQQNAAPPTLPALPATESWTQPKPTPTQIQYTESWNPAKPIPTYQDALKKDQNWNIKTN